MNYCFKTFRFTTFLLFCIAVIWDANAQRYVADQLFKDSISAREVKIAKGDTAILDDYITIPNGEPLEYRGESKSIYHVLMEHDGKLYSVHREDVMLSDDNEPGVVNVVQKEELAWRHTEIGHFVHTMKPYYLIVIIMVVTWLMSLIMSRCRLSGFMFGLLAFLVSIGLIAVALLEAATFAWCRDFLWWIDQDELGFWKTLLLMFPVIATILLQVNVGMAYKAAIEDWCGEDLSWRPAFIGLIVSLPLGLIAAIICNGSSANDLAFAIGLLTPLAIAFLICMAKNCRSLGFVMGLAFTIFSFVYAVGCIIAVGLAIVVLFRLTLTALIWIIPGFVLMAASGGTKDPERSEGSKSWIKREYEFNGKKYSSESEKCNAMNQWYSEQRRKKSE